MNEPAARLVGARVEAWTGPRVGEQGEIVRLYTVASAEIRFDSDGETLRYPLADIIRVELLPETTP